MRRQHPTCALVALALGLLPSCYLAHERDAPETCSVEPMRNCTTWVALGPPTTISTPLRGDEGLREGSVIADDCGVLIAWGISTLDASGTRVRHETRTADWSGAPTTASIRHPTLDVEVGVGPAQLARGAGGAAIVLGTDDACLFLPIDLEGRERGPTVRADARGLCGAVAGSEGGYSYLTTRPGSMGPVELQTVDPAGAEIAVATLFGPSLRTVWSRLVFDDGTFLAYSFSEDFITMRYTSRLQRFDAAGLARAAEVEIDENAVPVVLSPTPRGALAVWATPAPGGLPIRIRPIDRDGAPTGETRDAPAEGALYGFALAPAPDGDALLVWTENHFDSAPEWELRALALAPDGTLRGEPTSVLTDENTGAPQLLVDPSGARALVVFADDTAVRAQALACAR